ncbi:MAG: matrixin family metalloprotease [Limnohabitans sp.]|nr:matrixin family metalloprotease [Limnohabitans sp.]
MKKYLILILVIAFGCDKSIKNNSISEKTILVQPFEDFSEKKYQATFKNLKKIYPNLKLLKPVKFPEESWNEIKTRRRADYLLKFLNKIAGDNQLIIGLTSKDISTTKGDKKDWGVFGLGNCPGKACVASDYRLKGNKSEKLFKVAIHELGHTEGLSHCPTKNCFMRDAEGKDHLNEETEFCKSCKENLLSNGWKLK